MLSKITYSLTLLFFLSLAISNAQNSKVGTAAPPSWVLPVTTDYTSVSQNNASTSGYYYLLVNFQENVKVQQDFKHLAIKILNNDGVQEMSDISIDFDPNYQKLLFHSIKIIRGKAEINKLKQEEIRVVQRETNLESHLYDGALTAIVNLKDIRVGDIIEYSYSINGYNPIYNGVYSDKKYLQYAVPLEHLFLRILLPVEKKVQFKFANEAASPISTASSTTQTYIWNLKKVQPVLYDSNTPGWYDPYAYVSISEYTSFESLVDWSLKLFALNGQEKKKLEQSFAGIVHATDKDSITMQAIRFVQDEVRYLGFENGIEGQKPEVPSNVIEKRYGDCKAKSFLLSELLQANGIPAYPVLVHSQNGHALEKEVPWPGLFDHCIVQIMKDGKAYYIDPTISNQGGDLAHFYFPNYHKGLILRKGEKALTDLSFSNYTSTKITETYSMKEVGKTADLRVVTIYSGHDADLQRNYFAHTTLQAAQKSYIDFYSSLYPGIKPVGNIRIQDQREGTNRFMVFESYTIDSVWENTENNTKKSISFYPLSLKDYVSVVQSPGRKMPYNVNYPLNIEHESIVVLPAQWTIDDESKVIETASFQYHFNVSYKADTLRIIHKYKTLCDYIDAPSVSSFVAKHDDVLTNFSYSLTIKPEVEKSGFVISWLSVFIAFLSVLISTYFAIKIYRNYDIPVYYSTDHSRPVGGWMVFLAIGLTVAPLQLIYRIWIAPEYFNSNVMSAYIGYDNTIRNLIWGLFMFFEMIYNFVLLVFSVLVVFLLYNRRTCFPLLTTIFYASSLLILIVDIVIALKLNPDGYTPEQKSGFYGQITKGFVSAIVWIPYLMHSVRVKETFIFSSNRN